MKSLLAEYDRLYPTAQVQCAEAPPVFQPVVGMMVSILIIFYYFNISSLGVCVVQADGVVQSGDHQVH